MEIFKKLEPDIRTVYKDNYFSGNYNQTLYLKRAIDDGSNKPKFYISAFTIINGNPVLQGYLYFYLDYDKKRSDFIGMAVDQEYRNLNIASLLVASWIDLCKNNGVDQLGVHYKQKKPFLIYLLKTFGFEIENPKLYETSQDLITLYRDPDFSDTSKILLFRSEKNEKIFMNMKIFGSDNYVIIHTPFYYLKLDRIILPLQSIKINKVDYELRDEIKSLEKVYRVISEHKKGI